MAQKIFTDATGNCAISYESTQTVKLQGDKTKVATDVVVGDTIVTDIVNFQVATITDA